MRKVPSDTSAIGLGLVASKNSISAGYRFHQMSDVNSSMRSFSRRCPEARKRTDSGESLTCWQREMFPPFPITFSRQERIVEVQLNRLPLIFPPAREGEGLQG